MWTGDFSVNNADRNDVVAFWHAVYQASEGYENRIGWTGNYSGNNGTVSGAFLDDVERRVNYFRAMCGLSSDTTVSTDSTVVIDSEDVFKPSSNTSKATAAQNAALMLVRNYNPSTGAAPALTHYPPNNLVGWSAAAWNANSKGNFAFGLYGPGAITEYMVEQLSKSATTSSWNSLVGHRRWNLYPGATTFATGDQPGTSASLPPSNVFYVVQNPDEIAEETAEKFVAYPPAGFFPAPINSPYWSLSHAGADFASATVKMTDASGNNVPIVSTWRDTSYGDPAIVWQVSPSASVQRVSKDTKMNVTVSGIEGDDVPTSYSYSVTLIEPNIITSNQDISGVSKVASNARATYTFTAPPGAEGVKVLAYKRSSAPWKENAESAAKSQVVDGTGKVYPLLVKPSSFKGFGGIAGSYSFHLTFPTSYDLITRGVPDQTFELGRDLITTSKSKLSFKYRRGFMTKGSYLAVEISYNDGVSWKAIGSTIRGVSDTRYDNSVSSASYALPASSSPARVRFRYYTKGGSIYTHEAAPKSPTGIFIDEITASRCHQLVLKKSNAYSPRSTFAFSSSTAGAKLAKGDKWLLRLSTKLGGKWLPQGRAKAVTITAP
jgi:hypothetical protein